MHTVENGRSSSGKLHYLPAKCNDELQETKGVIIKKYKIGNFDTKQLCKSLMLSLALQGSSAQLPAAWGKGAPDFLPLFAMCSSLHLVVVTHSWQESIYGHTLPPKSQACYLTSGRVPHGIGEKDVAWSFHTGTPTQRTDVRIYWGLHPVVEKLYCLSLKWIQQHLPKNSETWWLFWYSQMGSFSPVL